MTKFQSSAPMFFGPPMVNAPKVKPKGCDHTGYGKILGKGHKWYCIRCGAKVK